MRRVLPPDLASEIGRLDPSAIAEVRADAWPDVRDADELHDALLTLVALPEPESAPEAASASTASPLSGSPRALHSRMARSLRGIGRAAARHTRSARRPQLLGVCRKSPALSAVFAGAEFAAPLPEVSEVAASTEDALFALLGGWMAHAGPTTEDEMSQVLGLPPARSPKHSCAWRPTAPFCAGNSPIRSGGIPARSLRSPNGAIVGSSRAFTAATGSANASDRAPHSLPIVAAAIELH